MATILITGVNGFVGQHLVHELAGRGVGVVGVGNSQLEDAAVPEGMKAYIACDLTDEQSVAQLDFTGVDGVIHLAALASQAMSFDQPKRFIADNSSMVINLFERVLSQKLATNPRFVMISSGAVYDSNQPMPITEDSQVTHGSPYAISKLLGEMLGNYYTGRGVASIVVRPFNHTGPGQGPGFLLPDLVRQLHALGPDETLKVGNLATRRDYSDVRDVVRAYADLATATATPAHNLYNVCSGQSRSGQEVLEAIANAMFGQGHTVKTEVDESRLRPNDPPEIYGNHDRLSTDLGWQPQLPFEQTVRDYVDWFKANQT